MTFRADEGSFLAGVAAAAESKRGAVGFVGAMETQVVQALECGYETGIRWAVHELKRTVRGSVVYIGTTPEAFTDPAHGAAVSRSMIAQKDVDVLYAAAGASSAGVIDAAREANVRAIGVDATHTHLTRDVFITSVLKRFDRAIDRAIRDVRKQAFRGGGAEMNLANGGVDLALSGRLAPRTLKLVEKAPRWSRDGRRRACPTRSRRWRGTSRRDRRRRDHTPRGRSLVDDTIRAQQELRYPRTSAPPPGQTRWRRKCCSHMRARSVRAR